MRKQKTIQIEGFSYELTQLGGTEGRVRLLEFAKLFGKVLPFIASTKRLDEEAVVAVGRVLDDIDAKDIEPLWDAFSRSAWVRGKDGKTRELVADVFDDHFAGEYFAMLQFFVESARFNFSDFLAKAFGQLSDAVPDATP